MAANRKIIEISDALHELRPNSKWGAGDTYESIDWQDTEQTIPTREQIETEIARQQVIADALYYQRQRKAEYPSIVDQLDKLYHDGYDGWKAAIDIIKNKYPKP
jgi:hypothetical protein